MFVEPVLKDVIEIGHSVFDEPVEPLELVFCVVTSRCNAMMRRLTLSSFSPRRAVREARIAASRSGWKSRSTS
jgi:hypothetical protein